MIWRIFLFSFFVFPISSSESGGWMMQYEVATIEHTLLYSTYFSLVLRTVSKALCRTKMS
jgi:hypothetical protein